MRNAFAMHKLHAFFQQKILAYENVNDTLTNDVVSFEQPGPDQKKEASR